MHSDNFTLKESNSLQIPHSSLSLTTNKKNKRKIKDVEDETNDGKSHF